MYLFDFSILTLEVDKQTKKAYFFYFFYSGRVQDIKNMCVAHN